jgi:hypothetical protein
LVPLQRRRGRRLGEKEMEEDRRRGREKEEEATFVRSRKESGDHIYFF